MIFAARGMDNMKDSVSSALNLVQVFKHRPRPALPCHTFCLQVSLFWDTGSPSETAEMYCLGSSAFSLGLGNSCSTYTSKKHNPGKANVGKFTDCSLNFRLVKKLVSEKSDWVPSSILQPAEGDSNNIIKNSNAGNGGNVFLAFLLFFLHTKKRCDKKDVINSALLILMYLAWVFVCVAVSGDVAELAWNLVLWVSELVRQQSLPCRGLIVFHFPGRIWISHQTPVATSTWAGYLRARHVVTAG